MEPTDGPTKICPECKNKVFESETVCGFCGHVFTLESHVAVPAAETRICPECKAPVSVDATKCSICGHIFDSVSNVYAGSWPQTYYTQKWGANGYYSLVVMVAVAFALLLCFVAAVSYKKPHGLDGVGWLAAVVVVFILTLWAFASAMINNVTVTLKADRVEWTSVGGKEFSVQNADLNQADLIKGRGIAFKFGTKGGQTCLLSPTLGGFDEVVAEIKRRVVR